VLVSCFPGRMPALRPPRPGLERERRSAPEVVRCKYHYTSQAPTAATPHRRPRKYSRQQARAQPTILVDGKPAEVNGGGPRRAGTAPQFAAVLEKELESRRA